MANKYSDIITLREQKAAYNISDEQLGDWTSFIANEQFNGILRKVIASVRNNDISMHKSFWIQGTYGTGKSHAAAVIKHLLCDPLEEIAEYVNDEYKAEKYAGLRSELLQLRGQKRLFPVTLYGQSKIAHKEDLSLQLQRSISTALHKAKIDIAVKTDFDNYVSHIENDPGFWEDLIGKSVQLKSVAPTCQKLKTELKNGDLAILSKVRNALRERQLYIPIVNADLLQWFFEVQDQLAAQKETYGYDGLLVIWDEFTDVMTSDMGLSLLTALQQIDEGVMNPKNNSYFFYISHPSALNALNSEESEKTKGRYHYMSYNMEPVSAFKIMSRKFKVIDGKELNYHNCISKFYNSCNELLDIYTQTSTDPEESRRDIQNLFPLHPSTANLATYYAREAGSSSRSVFQFIGENGAIRQFLDSETHFQHGDTITADYLWDYVVEEFNTNPRFGMVTERFNSRKLQVESQGADHFAVFKSILLLNALNNIANNETVTPSEENIAHLFAGTSIEEKLTDILNYFDENGIIQRQPGGMFSIQFSALPTKEIEDIKNQLKLTGFKFTKQILNWGNTAEREMATLLNNVSRENRFIFFSTDTNEHTLLNQVENFYKKQTKPYELFMALLFARNTAELNSLKEIAAKAATDERFQNVVFIVFESTFGDKNYERFIEYQANASCANNHGFAEQTNTHNENAVKMIKEWLADVKRKNCTYYLRDKQDVVATTKITSTINSSISPVIFSKGIESLEIIRTSPKTWWKNVSARQVVSDVLQYNTKQEIIDKCIGSTKHVPNLLQDSVDENLEWKPDVDKNHPLYLVSEFIDKKFKYTDKSQSFNLGDKLIDLTKPPYGLYPSYAGMGMVAFAMRKYAKQIFDLNGKPREVKHLIEDVVEMFKAWENGKTSSKLNFRFETKESRNLCENFIKLFQLKTLPGYNDISSLTDARWAITHVFSEKKGYPLWALKYTNPNVQDGLKTLIDNILKICGEADMRNPDLIAKTLNGIGTYQFELGNLLIDNEAFKNGFVHFLKSIEIVHLQDDEFEEAHQYLQQHLEETVGFWREDHVEQNLLRWRIDKSQNKPEPVPVIIQPTPPTPTPVPTPAPNPIDLPQKREKAKEKIRQIPDVYRAKRLLEIICEQADDSIMDIINKYVNE